MLKYVLLKKAVESFLFLDKQIKVIISKWIEKILTKNLSKGSSSLVFVILDYWASHPVALFYLFSDREFD